MNARPATRWGALLVYDPSNGHGNGDAPGPRTWMRFVLGADASWTDWLELPSPQTEDAPPSPSRGQASTPSADDASITLYVFDDPATAAGASYHSTLRRHPDMSEDDAHRHGATRAMLSVTDDDGTIRHRLSAAKTVNGRFDTSEGPFTFQARVRGATPGAPHEFTLELEFDEGWAERDATLLELLGTLHAVLMVPGTSSPGPQR